MKSNDLFSSYLSKGAFLYSWIPVSAMVVTFFLSGAAKFVFPAALLLMATGCFINSRQCARRHCFYTAPYFAFLAVLSAMHGWKVISLGEQGWFIIVGLLAVGGFWGAKLIDKKWGNYIGNS